MKFLSKILPSPDPSCQTSLKYSVILSQFKDNCSSSTVNAVKFREKNFQTGDWRGNKALSSYCCVGLGRLQNIFNRRDQTGLDRSIDCYHYNPAQYRSSAVRGVWYLSLVILLNIYRRGERDTSRQSGGFVDKLWPTNIISAGYCGMRCRRLQLAPLPTRALIGPAPPPSRPLIGPAWTWPRQSRVIAEILSAPDHQA